MLLVMSPKLSKRKKLSKREEKAMIKSVKAKIDKGEDIDSDEEEFANEHKLWE